jgi:hypothetical protein
MKTTKTLHHLRRCRHTVLITKRHLLELQEAGKLFFRVEGYPLLVNKVALSTAVVVPQPQTHNMHMSPRYE